jgi:LysM repeat protein
MYSSAADTTSVLNPTAGQGLALGQDTGDGSGIVNEEFGTFTSGSLVNVGDSISLTADFTTDSTVTGNGGYLLVGLYNDNGSAPTGNLLNTATGGATATWTGYFGDVGYSTAAGSSDKFYSRPGGAGNANELGYYSKVTSPVQLSSTPATGNGTVLPSTPYVLTYTITKGATYNIITEEITQGGVEIGSDLWTTDTESPALNNTFNGIDFGAYGKAEGSNPGPLDLNFTDVSVVLTPVPEPSTLALAGLGGLGLLGMAMRFRQARG